MLLSSSAFAVGVNSTFSMRTGMLMGSVSAESLEGSLTTIPYFDLEYDMFMSTQMAWVLRGMLAIDVSSGDGKYFYGGVGQRYFFGGKPFFSERSEGGIKVVSKPDISYFIGWDGGLASVLVSRVGTFRTYSSAIDGGVTFGLNYFLFNAMATNIGVSASYIFGFSTVAASGMALKGFVGATF